MKRTFSILIALVMTMVSLCGCAAQHDEEIVIVTSFYPMYLFAQNVAKDVPGVTVRNMADQSVGCLHDYQLQTRDMVTLETADVLIVNGGGMEQFMEKVFASYERLPVVVAAEGIDMLESAHGGHAHDHEHAHGEECVLNAHVWLNPALAIEQVKNISAGLSAADPEHAAAYEANAAAYCARIEEMSEAIRAQLAPYAGRKIITFHEAFVYFAKAFGLEVAGLIEHDAGEEPGTRELAQTCDLVKALGVGELFVEPQYPQNAAQTIARETGAKIYQLNPVVSGDGALDGYERAMMENARVLTEAFAQ